MPQNQLLIFCLLLILPSLYQRTKFHFRRHAFFHTPLREKSGLQIHHGHWGLGLIFVSSFLLVFWTRNDWTVYTAALGWGLLLDEIIPNLKMPSTGREEELVVYARSRNGTVVLIGMVVIASVILDIVFK